MALQKHNPEALADEALMRLVGKGYEPAFEVLYQRYSGRLFAFVRNMLGYDSEQAKDLLQDIFLGLIEHPERFDTGRNFASWIFAVAANRCRNELRNNSNRQHILRGLATTIDQHVSIKYAGRDMQRFREQLYAFVDTFDEDTRLLFLLRFQQELPIREIARILDLPEGTVKSRLFYLMRRVAQKLRAYHPFK